MTSGIGRFGFISPHIAPSTQTLGSPHLLEYAHRREIKTLTILRSEGASTVIFMVDSTKVVISLVMHSPMTAIRGDLGAGPCGEAELGILAMIHGQALEQRQARPEPVPPPHALKAMNP